MGAPLLLRGRAPHVDLAAGLGAVEPLHRSSVGPYRSLFAGILTDEELAAGEEFAPSPLPEPPAFQAAPGTGRRLIADGRSDEAWAVLEADTGCVEEPRAPKWTAAVVLFGLGLLVLAVVVASW